MQGDNKNIERLFNERFDGSNVSNEGWNEPSDMVWERIEEEIEQSPKEKFGYLPFLLSTFLILSLVGMGFLIHKNERLKEEVQQVKKELILCGEEDQKSVKGQIIEMNTQPEESTELEGSPIISQEELKPSTNRTNQTYSQSKVVSESFKEKFRSNSKISEQYLSEVESSGPNETSFVNSTESTNSVSPLVDVLEESNKNRITTPMGISSVELTKEITSRSEKVIIPKIPKIVHLTDNASNSQGGILISSGMTYGFLQTSGQQDDPGEGLIDKEHGALGGSFEVLLNKDLNKNWAINVGAGIQNMSYVTEYDVNLNYNTENEIIDEANGFIDFEHSLPTSFGNTDTGLRLTRVRSSSTIDEPTVNLDFDTRHTFTTVYIPMEVLYKKQFADIEVAFGPRMAPSYIIANSSSIDYVASNHSEISSVNNYSESEYSDVSKWNVGVGASLRLSYPVGKNGDVMLNANFLQNVNAHFELNDFNSRTSQIGVNAGYLIKF